MTEKQDEHQKQLIKEALRELLDEQARAFGYLSLRWIGSVVLVGMITTWLISHGWKVPQIAP